MAGRILLVAAPYVLICAVFAPRGVQFLNPVMCQTGQHLHNQSLNSDGDKTLEVVCRSSGSTDNVIAKQVAVVLVLLVASYAAYTLAARLRRGRTSAPGHPAYH